MNTQTHSSTSKPIPDRMYFRIRDVADLLEVKPYVLRYWETEFSIVSPEKSATGQRVYRKSDVENLVLIKHLLYGERYSIEGAKKRIKELRKEGEFKAFKTERVMPAGPSPEEKQAREARLKEIKVVARELRGLSQVPMKEIFKY